MPPTATRGTALLAGAVYLLRRGYAWEDVIQVLGEDVVQAYRLAGIEAFDLAGVAIDGRAPQEPASGHSGDGWAQPSPRSGRT